MITRKEVLETLLHTDNLTMTELKRIVRSQHPGTEDLEVHSKILSLILLGDIIFTEDRKLKFNYNNFTIEGVE